MKLSYIIIWSIDYYCKMLHFILIIIQIFLYIIFLNNIYNINLINRMYYYFIFIMKILFIITVVFVFENMLYIFV